MVLGPNWNQILPECKTVGAYIIYVFHIYSGVKLCLCGTSVTKSPINHPMDDIGAKWSSRGKILMVIVKNSEKHVWGPLLPTKNPTQTVQGTKLCLSNEKTVTNCPCYFAQPSSHLGFRPKRKFPFKNKVMKKSNLRGNI